MHTDGDRQKNVRTRASLGDLNGNGFKNVEMLTRDGKVRVHTVFTYETLYVMFVAR